MTSLKYPENTQVSYMKGIIEEKRVKWSDYAPIMVDTLPFYIKAKPGAPVSHQPCLRHLPSCVGGVCSADTTFSHLGMNSFPYGARRAVSLMYQLKLWQAEGGGYIEVLVTCGSLGLPMSCHVMLSSTLFPCRYPHHLGRPCFSGWQMRPPRWISTSVRCHLGRTI